MAALKRDAGKGLSTDPDDLPTPLDKAEARAALAVIPPCCGYHQWFEIGCALKTAFGEAGWPLFDKWSSGCPEKYDAENIEYQWDHCGVGHFTAGTLMYYANEADPEWRTRFREQQHTKPKTATKKSSLDRLIKSARDLRAKEFKPQQWIVPLYIPEGLTLCVGKPKVGKSWLGLDIATAVSAGGTCLGQECEQGDVLALFLEDTDRRLQRRMQMMLGLSEWPNLTYATEWERFDVGGLALIEEWIKRVAKPRLVEIDVLQRVRTPPRGREPLYQADYNTLTALHDLAGEAQISIIVYHHQRKLSADDIFDTASGTLGLTGAADHLLILERAQLGKCLLGRGRDTEEFNVAVKQDEWFRWQVLGPTEEVLISEKRATIMNMLKEGGEMRVAEIADRLGETPKNTKVTLAKMHTKGEVERVRLGVYRLPKRQTEMDFDDKI